MPALASLAITENVKLLNSRGPRSWETRKIQYYWGGGEGGGDGLIDVRGADRLNWQNEQQFATQGLL